ncbi:MAG: hypothetical protein N2116_04275 [Armatimonadetes bacterium]|nr:hypothetical protein [Armatimonadota bacterium]
MRRRWTLTVALVLFAALSLAIDRGPEPVQPRWLVSFQRQSGGLLSLLRLPDFEAPKINGMAIYTDWGILKPYQYEPVGSQNENEPKVSELTSEGWKVVIVEGQLKDRQGQPCGLKYRVVHRFTIDGVILEISLVSERVFKSMHGFLAAMLNFSDATEWFACTRKGWLFAETLHDGRVFQSVHEPLDNNKPVLGVANPRTGWGLVLTLEDASPNGLDNVFIHANPKGSGGIFLAWCDGITTREMNVGEEWRVSVKLSFSRFDELLDATE